MLESPWYRLALSLLLLFAIISLWWSRFDEFAYHAWSNKELHDIGEASSFAAKAQEYKVNDFVSVSGVLSNKAATVRGLRAGSLRFGPLQVRQLLGSNLYLEYPEEKYHKIFRPFMRVSVKGRLASFKEGSEMDKVRHFFAEHYNKAVDDSAMLIVVDEEPKSAPLYIIFLVLSLSILTLSFYFSWRGFKTISLSSRG